jgi:hypothetical protein
MFDICLFALPAGLLLGVIAPTAFAEPGGDQLLGIALLFAWAFIEALLISSFSATPGKWLFNIYKRAWPVVEDVSAKESFDLRCRKGKNELRVEVKGTTTGAGSILLTRNEVRHAEDPTNHVALFVVSGILVDSTNNCSGGVPSVIEPWIIDREKLDPIAYEYDL